MTEGALVVVPGANYTIIMNDMLPAVRYDQMLRAARAVNLRPELGMIELAIAEEFGVRAEPAYLELVNAVSRRMVALSYFIKSYRGVINRNNLTEYRLLNAAAVAPLGYAEDGFNTDSFVEAAKSFPESE